jgi:serine/threonine protein kinase
LDRDTGEQVALKKLLRFDTKSVMRLKREFRALANMHHPNLVKLYDLGRSSDAWFLTMEYLEGVDLLAHLGVGTDVLATNHGGYQMPAIERVLSTFHQLARGVNALHEAKLLHRDLKPTNVMVTAGRVVALDFGLACALDEEDRMVTHDGTVAGTPAYMPPEQALGQTLSEVSDWYAVGVMLYQVLSGQLPIDGRNANELLRRKLDRDPTPLSRLNSAVPARLENL